MKTTKALCPFSKPILGKWCSCIYAKLAERCSGKMFCTRTVDFMPSCIELDQAFKSNSRFILGTVNSDDELTHAQLMKIRCGGLAGMKRVLAIESTQPVNVREVIDKLTIDYGSIEKFPYNQIVQDIKNFKHRKPG